MCRSLFTRIKMKKIIKLLFLILTTLGLCFLTLINKNKTFAGGGTGWQSEGIGNKSIETDATLQKKVLKVFGGSFCDGPQKNRVIQRIDVLEGTTYLLSLKAKGNGKVGAGIICAKPGLIYDEIKTEKKFNDPANSGWSDGSWEINIDDNTCSKGISFPIIGIWAESCNDEEAWLADVSLKEKPVISGWIVSPNANFNAEIVNNEKYAGKNSLKLTTKKADNSTIKEYTAEEQWFSTQVGGGKNYTFSGCAKKVGDAMGSLRIDEYSDNNQFIEKQEINFTNNNWECKTIDFQSKENARMAAVTIQLGRDDVLNAEDPNFEPPTDFYVDELSLVENKIAASPSSSANPSFSPFPSFPPESTGIIMDIKFAGVPANDNEINLPQINREQNAKVIFEKITGGSFFEQSIPFRYVDKEKFEARFTVPDANFGTQTSTEVLIKVKGPSHRRMVFCLSGDNFSNNCPLGARGITITKASVNKISLNLIPLDFGDVDKNGSVGVQDYSKVLSCVRRNAQIGGDDYRNECYKSDANLDGVVDVMDISILYNTLSNKPDDE